MSNWTAKVIVTKEYEVSIEADTEKQAGEIIDKMTDAQLNEFGATDENQDYEDLECTDCDEDEDKEDED